MPFGLWARMGPRNHVLDGVQRCGGTLPWQPILGLILLLTGFVWTIATRQLVTEGFEWSADRCRYRRYPVPKGRCHGNYFWLSIYGVHIGATWRIRLNRACAAAMWPYVKLLWSLVIIIIVIRPPHSSSKMQPIATHAVAGLPVCLSVRLTMSVRLSVDNNCEPRKSDWNDREFVRDVDSGGTKEPCMKWVQIPMRSGNF